MQSNAPPGRHTTGVTILIATYNRADTLRETFGALAVLDYASVDCEIVVIDNNSRDHTKAVVESFQDQLPISYLRELRPGKNAALNKALREWALKEIVVFTDDDVTPERDWLQQIVCGTRRRRDVAVFGGKVEVQWPSGERQVLTDVDGDKVVTITEP